MSTHDSSILIQQIEQYILQLEQIHQQLNMNLANSQQPHLQLLQAKINAKIKHFDTAVYQLHYSNHSPAGIKQLANHLASVFQKTVKEAHRLLQMKVGQGGKQKLKEKLELLNRLEGELDEEWSGANKGQENRLLRKIGENTSILADHIDQTQLRSLAKQYLHKEFLAIRMVAYRMYQSYSEHGHPQVLQQMEELRQEQEQLSQLLQQLSQTNKELRGEQRRLVRELNELKKVNEMVAKRYFQAGHDSRA